MSKRTVIKIAGESGMGIESSGMIVMKALKNLGFWVYGEREFPSLIKGGRANIQINFSGDEIRSLSNQIQIGLAIDREGLLDCLETLSSGGILIHGFERWNKVIKNLPQLADEKKLQVIQLPAREIAMENGGNLVMTNTVLLGFLWKVLGLNIQSLKDEISRQFAKKPEVLPINFACCEGGYNFQPGFDTDFSKVAIDFNHSENEFNLNQKIFYLNPAELQTKPPVSNSQSEQQITNSHFADEKIINEVSISSEQKAEMPIPTAKHSARNPQNSILIDGNTAIGLGAIHAGVRAYYAYPMSPSSSILVYLAKVARKTGMLVKQVEDEISVAQMTLGSMHVGTRAMCATSGGGFDLMTETISLSAMIETPMVVAIAQRPGPATGLPTWTGQADLNLALYSGHGEFTRCIIACSDPVSCFENTQHAFNIAEKFQIPVILLTEANIAMSYKTEAPFTQNTIPVERGLVEPGELDNLSSCDRYKISEDGISKRWLPGQTQATYFANGDEHWEDGSLTEDADKAEQMIEKRIKKTQTLKDQLPEPEIYGNLEKAKIGLVGWGSTKNAVLDAIQILSENGIEICYLNYNFVWPLKTAKIREFFVKMEKTILVEGNHEGQLGKLIFKETGLKFHHELLKWNGRPFYVEEIVGFVENIIQS